MSDFVPTPTGARVVQLRGMKNLRAKDLTPCEPWTFVPDIPAEANENKEALRLWQTRETTEHLFFTATEPLNPAWRPSKLNPPARLHGLIADYDVTIGPGMLEKLLDRCADALQPAWVSRTFSGGARLVWLFEEPMAMDQPHLAEKFLAVVKKELRLAKLLPGLDEPAWKDLIRLYDVGTEWRALSEQRISPEMLNYWLFEAAAKADAGRFSDTVIPLPIVEEEVHRRFPGRWDGPFEEGARGVVFFSTGSDNPTAAVVAETGMFCYSQEKSFYSWKDIFGPGFVAKYEADKIGGAAGSVYFDGRFYWKPSAAGYWDSLTKEDLGQRLRVDNNIEPVRRRGETASELDRVLVYIQKNRRVDGVGPRIYCPDETFTENGKKMLNTSRVRAMEPAATPQEWGVEFPWLADFLDTCWAKPASTQRDHFLAWWKRFYVAALNGSISKGQALFLAGPVGRGKTLLTSIVAEAMGGSALAGEFLLTNTAFNKELLETGVWLVDDAVASQNHQDHLRFSEKVKMVVANTAFSYMPKGRDAVKVTWYGRLIVALNDNDAGIGMVPALEPSIEDKLMILRFTDARRTFPERHELEAIIRRELPSLLRWMVDLEIPEAVIGESRFGCKSYIHPALRIMAIHSSGLNVLLDIVKMWISRKVPREQRGGYWTGTATEWLMEIQTDVEGLRGLVSKFTPTFVARQFGQAARIKGTGITRPALSKHKGNGTAFTIDYAEAGPDDDEPRHAVVVDMREGLDKVEIAA